MENISLLIVTDDKEYGRALSRAILYLCSRVLIRLAEKEEFFEKVREAGEVAVLDSADMILWDGQEAEQVYGGKIVLLSEKPSMAVRNPGEKKILHLQIQSGTGHSRGSDGDLWILGGEKIRKYMPPTDKPAGIRVLQRRLWMYCAGYGGSSGIVPLCREAGIVHFI